MDIYVYICIHMHIYIYVYVCAYMCIYVYIAIVPTYLVLATTTNQEPSSDPGRQVLSSQLALAVDCSPLTLLSNSKA